MSAFFAINYTVSKGIYPPYGVTDKEKVMYHGRNNYPEEYHEHEGTGMFPCGLRGKEHT